MKKWFLSLAILIIYCFSSLQAQERTHELGIRLTDINDFGFIYKKSNDGIKFTRYRVALANLNISLATNSSAGLEMNFARGIEKRRGIAKNLQFIHGWEPGIYVNLRVYEPESFNASFGGFVGYVLGFQYNFSPQFYVNIETIPSLSLIANFNDRDDNSLNAIVGFNANALALTMAYVFNTPM